VAGAGVEKSERLATSTLDGDQVLACPTAQPTVAQLYRAAGMPTEVNNADLQYRNQDEPGQNGMHVS